MIKNFETLKIADTQWLYNVISTDDVCKWLNLSEKTLLKMIREDEFPCKQAGKNRFFTRAAIIEWINNSK